MTYEQDKTVGHREYHRMILEDVRREAAANKSLDNLTEEELELLTRPEGA